MSTPCPRSQRIRRVASWRDFMAEVDELLDGRHVFRGVSSAKLHRLVPSVGRGFNALTYDPEREREIFKRFRREAVPHLPIPSAGLHDLDWLAIAQHHGVPTRLLDWTESPLVAAHFAFATVDERDPQGDPGIHVLPLPPSIDRSQHRDPFEVPDVGFLYSGHVTRRIAAQKGLFTVHSRPTEEYEPPGALLLVVDRGLREEFLRKLDTIGFNHGTIWDDLDGVCRHLAWVYRRGDPAQPMTPRDLAAETGTNEPVTHPDDPQKERWGGDAERNGWKVVATVSEISTDWFAIELRVGAAAEGGPALEGAVEFHLHDSFPNPLRKRKANEGKARLSLEAYGAFTVGVRILADGTELEIDLAELPEAPRRFRER